MVRYMILTNDYPHSLVIKENLTMLLDNNDFMEDIINPDYVFIIGGDGTLLKAVNELQDIIDEVCFIPIKSGSLGFYSTFDEHDYDFAVDAIVSGHMNLKPLPLLEVTYGHEMRYGLNEIKIVDHVKTLRTNVYVNGELLEHFRGSGLVFATSTGSTGYMRAIEGAIILSDRLSWEMKEIAPVANATFSTINSPIILDANHEVKLRGELTGKNIIIDTYQYDLKHDEVDIKLSDKNIQVLFNPSTDLSLTTRLKTIFALNGEEHSEHETLDVEE